VTKKPVAEWTDLKEEYQATLAFSKVYDITSDNTAFGQLDGTAALTAKWTPNTYYVSYNNN
jgi:hypothetical protein